MIGGIFEILVDLEYGSIFDVLSRLSKIWPFHSDIAKDTLQILYHSMQRGFEMKLQILSMRPMKAERACIRNSNLTFDETLD